MERYSDDVIEGGGYSGDVIEGGGSSNSTTQFNLSKSNSATL